MEFLWPWSFLLLIPWLGIWFLLRRAAGTEKSVPFLPLWQGADLPGPSPRKRRLPPLSLLFIWLGLLLALAAATGPVILAPTHGSAEDQKPIAILIDRGLANSTYPESPRDNPPKLLAFQQQLKEIAGPLSARYGPRRPADRILLPGSTSRVSLENLWTTDLPPTALNTSDLLLPAIESALSSGKYAAVVVLTDQGLPDATAIAARQLSAKVNVPVAFVPATYPIHTLGITRLAVKRQPNGQLQAMVRIQRRFYGQNLSPLNPATPSGVTYSTELKDASQNPFPRDLIRGSLILRANFMILREFTLPDNQEFMDMFVDLPVDNGSSHPSIGSSPTPDLSAHLIIPPRTEVAPNIGIILGAMDNLPWDDHAYLSMEKGYPRLVVRGIVPDEIQRVMTLFSRYQPPAEFATEIDISRNKDWIDPDHMGIILEDYLDPIAFPATAPTPSPAGSSTEPSTAVPPQPASAVPSATVVQSELAVDFSPEALAVIAQMIQPGLPPPPKDWKPLFSYQGHVLIAESGTTPNRLWTCMDQKLLARQPEYVVLWARMIQRLSGPGEQWSCRSIGPLPAGYVRDTQDRDRFFPDSLLPSSAAAEPGLLPGQYKIPNGPWAAVSPDALPPEPRQTWMMQQANLPDPSPSTRADPSLWFTQLLDRQLPPTTAPAHRIHLHVLLIFASLAMVALGAVLWPRHCLTLPAGRRTVKD